MRVGGCLDGRPCNHVSACTGQCAICRNEHEPNGCRCCHCALLDDPGSAVCRAHEARRLKPLHASTKTGPNWRPSAVHGPASTCSLATLCCHLLAPSRQTCPSPSLFNAAPAAQSRRAHVAVAPRTIPLSSAARWTMEPISRTGGHQAARSRGPLGAIHFALCRVGGSANSIAPAGGPCHSRAQR